MQLGTVGIVRTTVKSFLMVAALAGPALADDLPPVPDHALTIGVVGHGGKVGTTPIGGWGPVLELSLGQKRWQYFIEGALIEERIGPEEDRISGRGMHAGGGIRWLARSFELGDKGSIDLHFEAFGGYSKLSFAGKSLGRPELGLGVGYQIRALLGHDTDFPLSQFGFRLSARVYFSPTDRRDAEVACRGTCPTSGTSSMGLMAVFGAEL